MGVGIAKIDEESIAQKLRNVSFVALDNFGTNSLICTYHVTPVFRVELAGELCRVHQITEHYGQLPSFRVRRRWCSWRKYTLWRLIVLGRRLCLCLDRW